MNKMIAASVVAVLCHVGTASAGVPGWCKEATFDDRYDLRDLSRKEPYVVIPAIAKATCKPNAEAAAATAQIEAARQAWGKKYLMNDADWADAVDFANVKGNTQKLELSVKDLAAMTPIDQYIVITASDGAWNNSKDYLADMFEPNLTEVGRYAYVRECAKNTSLTGSAPVVHAQCQADIDAFDRAKFAAQLRSDTAHPGANKMEIRFAVSELTKLLEEHAAIVKKIHATDAAYKKLWEAAARGRAQYASTIGTDKALVALAQKLDSAELYQSRKQFAGCEAPTEAALTKAIADHVSASLFKDVKRDTPALQYDYMDPSKGKEKAGQNVGRNIAPILADIPELMFAAGPYIECHKSDHLTEYLYGLFGLSPGFRGPRRAALAAMMHENIVLDDINSKIDYPNTKQPFMTSYGAIDSKGGVVASTKEDKGHLVIEFGKENLKDETCLKSHYTNKVSRVNSDGSLSYELICDKYGPVVWDNTPDPMHVATAFKDMMKKGVQFSAVGYAVIVAWPSAKAKLPSHVLGVEVK